MHIFYMFFFLFALKGIKLEHRWSSRIQNGWLCNVFPVKNCVYSLVLNFCFSRSVMVFLYKRHHVVHFSSPTLHKRKLFINYTLKVHMNEVVYCFYSSSLHSFLSSPVTFPFLLAKYKRNKNKMYFPLVHLFPLRKEIRCVYFVCMHVCF